MSSGLISLHYLQVLFVFCLERESFIGNIIEASAVDFITMGDVVERTEIIKMMIDIPNVVVSEVNVELILHSPPNFVSIRFPTLFIIVGDNCEYLHLC